MPASPAIILIARGKRADDVLVHPYHQLRIDIIRIEIEHLSSSVAGLQCKPQGRDERPLHQPHVGGAQTLRPAARIQGIHILRVLLAAGPRPVGWLCRKAPRCEPKTPCLPRPDVCRSGSRRVHRASYPADPGCRARGRARSPERSPSPLDRPGAPAPPSQSDGSAVIIQRVEAVVGRTHLRLPVQRIRVYDHAPRAPAVSRHTAARTAPAGRSTALRVCRELLPHSPNSVQWPIVKLAALLSLVQTTLFRWARCEWRRGHFSLINRRKLSAIGRRTIWVCLQKFHVRIQPLTPNRLHPRRTE